MVDSGKWAKRAALVVMSGVVAASFCPALQAQAASDPSCGGDDEEEQWPVREAMAFDAFGGAFKDGSAVAKVPIEHDELGQELDMPRADIPVPSRKGYEFQGWTEKRKWARAWEKYKHKWNLSEKESAEWDEAYENARDVASMGAPGFLHTFYLDGGTLYACWAKKTKKTVRLYWNYGKRKNEVFWQGSRVKAWWNVDDRDIVATRKAPKRKGYRFYGWSTTRDAARTAHYLVRPGKGAAGGGGWNKSHTVRRLYAVWNGKRAVVRHFGKCLTNRDVKRAVTKKTRTLVVNAVNDGMDCKTLKKGFLKGTGVTKLDLANAYEMILPRGFLKGTKVKTVVVDKPLRGHYEKYYDMGLYGKKVKVVEKNYKGDETY